MIATSDKVSTEEIELGVQRIAALWRKSLAGLEPARVDCERLVTNVSQFIQRAAAANECFDGLRFNRAAMIPWLQLDVSLK